MRQSRAATTKIIHEKKQQQTKSQRDSFRSLIQNFKTNDEMRVCSLCVSEHIVPRNVNSASAIPIAIDFQAQRSIRMWLVLLLLLSISVCFFYLFLSYFVEKKCKLCIGARD